MSRLRNRQVKATFWTDGELLRWPRSKRMFYQSLWAMAEDSGCIEDDPFEWKITAWSSPMDADLTVETLADWRDELLAAGKAVRYEADGKRYLYLTRMAKLENPRNPQSPDLPLPPWITWVVTGEGKGRRGDYVDNYKDTRGIRDGSVQNNSGNRNADNPCDSYREPSVQTDSGNRQPSPVLSCPDLSGPVQSSPDLICLDLRTEPETEKDTFPPFFKECAQALEDACGSVLPTKQSARLLTFCRNYDGETPNALQRIQRGIAVAASVNTLNIAYSIGCAENAGADEVGKPVEPRRSEESEAAERDAENERTTHLQSLQLDQMKREEEDRATWDMFAHSDAENIAHWEAAGLPVPGAMRRREDARLAAEALEG